MIGFAGIRITAEGPRTMSWEDYGAQRFDFVITLCDKASEECPAFPAHPVTAHCGYEDPAEAGGDEQFVEGVFARVALDIAHPVELLCALPIKKFERLRLE